MPGSVTKLPTTSFVHPSTIKQRPTTSDPATMKGLRLPHFDLELSASTPTTGCMISPDRGPAIHTRDVRLLVRPSWRRYGVQSVNWLRIRPNEFFLYSEEGLTCHLDTPGEPADIVSSRSPRMGRGALLQANQTESQQRHSH